MKIKTRIKRALAGFLRDELLEAIGYNTRMKFVMTDQYMNPPTINHVPFETLQMEVDIPIDINGRNANPYGFEQRIQECREQFAERVMDHIHVEAQDLATRESFMSRRVRFVLRVQAKR